MVGRREKTQSILGSRIAIAIFIGVLLGCVCAVLYPHGFFTADPLISNRRLVKSVPQVESSSCESPERIKVLKADIVSRLL